MHEGDATFGSQNPGRTAMVLSLFPYLPWPGVPRPLKVRPYPVCILGLFQLSLYRQSLREFSTHKRLHRSNNGKSSYTRQESHLMSAASKSGFCFRFLTSAFPNTWHTPARLHHQYRSETRHSPCLPPWGSWPDRRQLHHQATLLPAAPAWRSRYPR